MLHWLNQHLIEPLDAVSVATLVLASVTTVLAVATVLLARRTSQSVGVERDAFLADIRAVLADVPEAVARQQGGVTIRPDVASHAAGEVTIRVPLRNVGSGLALLVAPEFRAHEAALARSITSTTLTSAVPAGEVTDMIFGFEFADDARRLEFQAKLHARREFIVVARCRDMNGEQEIRTEARIAYTPPRGAQSEGPTYSGDWRFGEVRLFHGGSTKPFAELPRSRVTTVTGAAVLDSTTGMKASGETETPNTSS